MLNRLAKMKPFVAACARIGFFVTLILLVPFLILWPATGLDYPTVPAWIGLTVFILFYAGLALFGGFFGVFIVFGLVAMAWHRLKLGYWHERTRVWHFAWYIWGAIVAWAMCVGGVAKIVELCAAYS